MQYFKTKNSRDYPLSTIFTYERLNKAYGQNARVSDIFNLWKLAYELEEFDLLDLKQIQAHEFLSYFMDKIIEWNQGKEVDLLGLYKDLLEAGEFSLSERRLFELGEPENKMWAVILAITDPTNKNKIY